MSLFFLCGFYTQRALIEVAENNFWSFVRDAVQFGS